MLKIRAGKSGPRFRTEVDGVSCSIARAFSVRGCFWIEYPAIHKKLVTRDGCADKDLD